MANLIKTDMLLGSPKVIVGENSSDLVLQTLGKVYIQSGGNFKLINDLFKLLDNVDDSDEDSLKVKILTVNNQDELISLEYPGDGYFCFNKHTQILYISFEGEWIAIVDTNKIADNSFVKKSGDIMTGQLDMRTTSAPFIVTSKKMVENFNANYLEGYDSKAFARRDEDEKITGKWTFADQGTSLKHWQFNKGITVNQDIVAKGNIGSERFASGLTGYGWKMDADTNTLTVDNLVVRKVMRVYEMVINKITATNGSIWVANSSKCSDSTKPVILDLSKPIKLNSFDWYLLGEQHTIVENTNLANATSIPESGKEFIEYKYIINVNNPEELTIALDSDISKLNNEDFLQSQDGVTLTLKKLIESSDCIDTKATFTTKVNDTICDIYLYYKYFGMTSSNNYRVIETDKDEYPLFKVGDILRCQKFIDGNIKYYDAIVTKQLTTYTFLIQVAYDVFDKYAEIEQGNTLAIQEAYNKNLYKRTDLQLNDDNIQSILGDVSKGDDLIQIGNIQNIQRQNALYLTSSDDNAPYIDVIVGLNRPDYSVPYYVQCGDESWGYVSTTKVRLGKLDGITEPKFPSNKQPQGYGLYGENVYLTGDFYLNNGKSVIDASQEALILKFGDAGIQLNQDNDGNWKVTISNDILDIDLNAESTGDETKVRFQDGTMCFYRISDEVTEAQYKWSGGQYTENNPNHNYLVEQDESGNITYWIRQLYLGYNKPSDEISEKEPLLVFCDKYGNPLYNLGPSGMFNATIASPKIESGKVSNVFFRAYEDNGYEGSNGKLFRDLKEDDANSYINGKFFKDYKYARINSGNNDVQRRFSIGLTLSSGIWLNKTLGQMDFTNLLLQKDRSDDSILTPNLKLGATGSTATQLRGYATWDIPNPIKYESNIQDNYEFANGTESTPFYKIITSYGDGTVEVTNNNELTYHVVNDVDNILRNIVEEISKVNFEGTIFDGNKLHTLEHIERSSLSSLSVNAARVLLEALKGQQKVDIVYPPCTLDSYERSTVSDKEIMPEFSIPNTYTRNALTSAKKTMYSEEKNGTAKVTINSGEGDGSIKTEFDAIPVTSTELMIPEQIFITPGFSRDGSSTISIENEGNIYTVEISISDTTVELSIYKSDKRGFYYYIGDNLFNYNNMTNVYPNDYNT